MRTRRSVAVAVLVVLTLGASAGPAAAAPLRDEAPSRLRVGAAVRSAATLAEPAYARTLAREYASGTPENHLKWQLVHPAPAVYDFADADAQLAFLEAHAMTMRGHTLVWHRQNPAWLEAGLAPSELRAALDDHVATVVGRYAGRIGEWDVVNEALADDGGPRSTLWSEGLGFPGYLDRAFRRAAEADPAARLFYNDYGLELPGPKQDAAVALLRGMLRRGVPVDGVGLQFHLPLGDCGTACTNRFLASLLRFGRLGLRVAVTELDVSVPLPASADELDRQGRLYGAVARACLLAPACRSITTWGFTDRYSWIPGNFPGFGAALPFRADYTRKPAHAALARALADPPRAPRCSDYPTRAAAQRALDRGVLGAPLLDRDADGRAC